MTALKNSNSESSPYYSQHDTAVVERLRQLGANPELGDVIYYSNDEDLTGVLQDFGFADPNLSKE